MSKSHGKGLGISVHGGTNDTNAWKMRIEAQTFAEPPVREFKPLKSWPAREHLRQGEIDALRAAPSVFDNRGR